MAVSSVAASKLLNLRNSALHNLICRRLLLPSAAASKNLLPFTSNQSLNLILLKIGGVKSHGHSSIACLPQWPLCSSLMQIGAVRIYASKGDNDSDGVEGFDDGDDDDEFDEDDDIENYSGSDFDDEDECEDPDEVLDSK